MIIKIYEEWMKGNKTYKKEFISSIKEYNKDLYEDFLEVKTYPKPPIELIDSIISSLINNYNKFETFHRQEMMIMNLAMDKFESELHEAKTKINKLNNIKREEKSSYE